MLHRLTLAGLLWGISLPCWAPVLPRGLQGAPVRFHETSEPSVEFPAVPDLYRGIPGWVMRGILYRETKSRYRADGSIIYVDRRRGLSGEVGAFQVMPDVVEAFTDSTARQVHRDPRRAEEAAAAYLAWLIRGPAKGSWSLAIRMYNVGPSGDLTGKRALNYLAIVTHAGQSVPQR